jgi:hypothetical protein
MSWNISTRLNNLQQQVNNIANSGLTNPLEQVLNANNYSLTNLNILDSGSNVLKLQSSNIEGITTNCDLSVDGNITCNTLNYTTLNPPVSSGNQNLAQVLQNGDDANNYSMQNINTLTTNGDIETKTNIFCDRLEAQFEGDSSISCSGQIVCQNLDVANNIFCGEINANIVHYTTLDPPISGAGQNIEQVLQTGNDANGQTIQNLTNLTVGGFVYTANGDPLGANTIAEFGVFNNNGDNGYKLGIGNTAGSLNEFNTFKIQDLTGQQYLRIDNASINQITLSADKLLYKTDTTQPASATGYILDSYKQVPNYRQIFSNINKSLSLTLGGTNPPSYLFGCNIYDNDMVFNYGITYAEILFSSFNINFTSDDPFLAPNSCQLYLGSTPTSSFDATKGNRIVFGVVDNAQDQPNYTFNSSIPIILYYQNGDQGTSFNNLYLNIQIQDEQTYYININDTNFVVSSYISGKLTDPIAWND